MSGDGRDAYGIPTCMGYGRLDFGLHDELELLVEARVSPLQALHAALFGRKSPRTVVEARRGTRMIMRWFKELRTTILREEYRP